MTDDAGMNGARIVAAILEAKRRLEVTPPGPREVVLSSYLPPIRVRVHEHDFMIVHPSTWEGVERQVKADAAPYVFASGVEIRGDNPRTMFGIPVFDHDAAMKPNRGRAARLKASLITQATLQFLDLGLRSAIHGPRAGES